ncbi:Retrovirus-related Pol polyprotein from transposon [Smittium culicis]|uniref:Retrovirus-related Pol polyprotein from transposon n=1 Tax=Smittium culicis TaxID=133412 RepID=A0A1R1XMB3_9FUNG|nr:Retrovirus-related Pol polyprotein from transposon [Smittium culicis]
MKAKIVNKDLGSAIIKKCKDLKVELSLQELASVSPQIRKSLNDEFRVKRVAEVGKIENEKNFISEEYYITNVRTRYKKASEKVKTVAKRSLNFETPGILDNDTNDNKLRFRLTDENISKINIGSGNLTSIEKKHFISILKKYDKSFAFRPEELGLLRETVERPVVIETVHHNAWIGKHFPIPKPLLNDAKEFIKNKISLGILEPTNGPYSNPWSMIRKKDTTKMRFIQDVREANKVTIRNAGVPPVIDEFSEDFGGRLIYSTFDLMSGYDQISIEEESRDVFSIQTPLGLVRMTRLPMVWCNSVAIFQRIMNKVFFKFIPEHMSIFLDDGIIKGSAVDDKNVLKNGTQG